MAKYQSKAKTQKAYNKNPARESIIPANCVAVFPMLIVSGSTYVTEHGIMPQNLTYDKGSFLFWQEVFDGRSSIKIQWDGAITLEKPVGENYYLAEPKVGKYFFGKPISSGTESLEIGDDQSFDEFITMKANQTVKIRFEFQKSNRLMFDNLKEDLRFVDNDLYKLYLIPEICEGKLMYISDYEEIYEDKSGLSYACEITFQSLGSELQKSGKAVEQYPQWSAPGEFYVKPKIEYSVGNIGEKRITIDQKGLNPAGIKYLQVELQGPALISCMYALGRRQEKDEATGKWKIGASHHLLGYQFVSNQPNPLNRTSVPTKNFDCFYNEEVCFATNAEFLQLLTDKLSQPLEQMKNGGLISLGHNTNDWNNVANGINNSNIPQDSGNGPRYDYYDENWKPLSYLQSNFVRDTNGCVYAEDEIEYRVDEDRMIDIMNKNVFTFNQQPVIPLSMYATRPFYLKSIPLVGSIANFFSLGDIHLFNNTTNRQTSNLIFFGDADLMAVCANLQQGMIQADWKPFKQTGKIAFPINFFGNNETSYNKLGVNSVNTTLCIELTDQIILNSHGSTNVYNTLYLGQNTYEDGTPIFPSAPEDSLLVNGSLGTVNSYFGGYIIDAVVIQTIFDGKIRISAYSVGDGQLLVPEWTTTVLSNASWEGGAMRDWTNMYILSNWTDRFCRQQDEFTYPLAPHKPSTEFGVIECNLKKEYVIENYGNGALQGLNAPHQISNNEEWGQLLDNYMGRENVKYTERNSPFTRAVKKYYTELGIEEITDRDSFIEYFQNIQMDFQQTNVDIQQWDGQKFASIFNNIWNEGYKYIGSLEENVYDYYFDCPIVSMRNELEGWQNHNFSFNEGMWLYGTNIPLVPPKPPFTPYVLTQLGITVKPRVHIFLAEDGIEISVVDKSVMPVWGSFVREGTDNLFLSCFDGDMSPIIRIGKMIYNILLNKIRFIRRGSGTTFSNSIYGLKHTETPLKSTINKK